MKKFWTSLSLLAGVTSLVACSSGKTEQAPSTDSNAKQELVTTIEKPVTIEFWHAMSGTNQEAVDALVEQFNSTIGAEKGITVEPVYQGAYNDLKTKTTAALKSGSAPAIAQAYPDWVAEYLQSGAVVALDDYIKDSEVGIKDFDDITQAYRDENSQYEGGKFYSLPFNKSTEVLYYNKTFFEENGLTVPTTWDEVEEVSAKIKELTGNPAFGVDSTQNYFITMVQQFGGQYTNSQGEILFSEDNAKAAIETLELLKRNTDAGYWRLAGEDKYMSGPFTSGLVSMYIGSSASYSFLQNTDFEWATAPIPQISDETKAVIQQGSNIVVFNQNKSAEEVYGAYEFVKFLCSTEGNLQWVLNTGYLPIRESVTNNEAYQQYVEESGDTTKITGPVQADAYFYEPSFFNDSYTATQVRSEMRTAVEKVVLAGEEPKAVLEYTLSLFK